eukprot:3982748-Amphidinium_carterae.1
MFSLKGQAAQTDTETSGHEDMEFLISIRRQLICKALRGATKVYTTEDLSFQTKLSNDVVIFQDADGNTEAHR